ncbi:hypothetical protein An04g03480 [Aspergillus niger]|uniref:Uncharacterized protein n=2 Tax=Aspergillus niger TaxID=5061 RepID=A2QIG9_ASPNC|nr:hypothetical protein An04g03480 [Aspergillus niger]CAK38613.1 hypothetical protein An04g03480 [Aspergillus niger]
MLYEEKVAVQISHISQSVSNLRGIAFLTYQPADHPVRTDHGVCFGSLVHDTMAPLYLSNLILVSNLRGISLPYQPAVNSTLCGTHIYIYIIPELLLLSKCNQIGIYDRLTLYRQYNKAPPYHSLMDDF